MAIVVLLRLSVELDVKQTAKVEDVERLRCGQDTDAMSYERRIGYYELFNVKERLCDKVYLEDLEVAPLTHVFKMIDTDGELISRVTFLKSRYQGLRVSVAIGVWAFNDPPTQTFFSDNIDWEYPAAPDRGGKPEHTDTFVLLMYEIRSAFDAVNPAWQSTLTLPTSYWYIRGFDVNALQDYVDFFNVMSYDLGHTNITEIEQGLDLLWRNGVGPNKVVMGFAFYGRGFTMSDPACSKPGCTFSTSGTPGTYGRCSHIQRGHIRNNSLDGQTFYDPKSTVKYNVFSGNQWIAYDDQQSLYDKKKYLTSRCLGGLMIWAIDQDTQNHDALEGLLGDFSSSQLQGGSLDAMAAAALSDAFGAFTGQTASSRPPAPMGATRRSIMNKCVRGGLWPSLRRMHRFRRKGLNFMARVTRDVSLHLLPQQIHARELQMERSARKECDRVQWFMLQDAFSPEHGYGPYNPLDPAECDNPDDEYQTFRYDDENGSFCSDSFNSPLTDRLKQAYCCPKGKGYKECN
ncbi:MAG: hypothetical protein Q9207_004110 [Kuettlingeria erythrocarpa]